MLISVEDEKVENLIVTLEIALKNLPADAHPAHRQRLNELIEKLEIKKACLK